MNVANVLAQASELHPVIVEVWERSPQGGDRMRVRHFVRSGPEGARLASLAQGYVVVRYGENWSHSCTTANVSGYVPPSMDYSMPRADALHPR